MEQKDLPEAVLEKSWSEKFHKKVHPLMTDDDFRKDFSEYCSLSEHW